MRSSIEEEEPFTALVALAQGGPAPTKVQDQLRERIVGGAPAGTELPSELALAKQFGVSKGVVREAMKVLVAQGLITVRHGRRATVNPSSAWNVFDANVLRAVADSATFEQLNDARRLVEPEIAYHAANNATAEDLVTLRNMLRDVRTPLEEHVVTDVAFHRGLAQATHNPILVILLDSLAPLLNENRRRMYEMEDAVERALVHHRQIYEAVVRADSDRARALMYEHLDDIVQAFSSEV